jgi:hypothetical protein
MSFHRNAKLGLAGRLALVRAVEEGCSLKAAAAAFNVSPATAHRWWGSLAGGGRGGAPIACLSARPLEPTALLAAAARTRARRPDRRLPARDRLGAAPGRRRDRLLSLHGLEGAEAGRDLATAADGA